MKSSASDELFIEAGRYGISLLILDRESNIFKTLIVYHFPPDKDGGGLGECIGEILAGQSLLKREFKNTTIIWSFDESILVPHEFMIAGTEKEMLDVVFGDLHTMKPNTDLLSRYGLHNIYRVPEEMFTPLTSLFVLSRQVHQFTLLPEIVVKADILFGIVYPNQMVIALKKAGKLQLVKNISYRTPEDAAFYLLSACVSFEMDIQKVTLVLSGMIDVGSNLYKEIYKYFLVTEFADLPDGYTFSEEIKDHPAHYFSHLFAQAACV